MNRFENWVCSSAFWRRMTQREVLPWLLNGIELGEHVLELGAGAGPATPELRRRAPRVTSLEYSHAFAMKIAQAANEKMSSNGAVLQGDASALPFPDKIFSAALAVLMLHHLKSPEAQERAFREVLRVLRPGGVFLALDLPDGWLHRVAHIRSTFVPIAPASAPQRLGAAGFANVALDFRRGAFRLQAHRPAVK